MTYGSKGRGVPPIRSNLAALLVLGLLSAQGPSHAETAPPPEAPRTGRLTFWGHASFSLNLDGFEIAVDPVFDPGYSPIHRREVPPPPPGALNGTRVVLISHSHPEHLSPTTLATLPDSTLVLCPPPAVPYVEKAGLRTRVMRPWEVARFGNDEEIAVVAVPALHPGGRVGFETEADLSGGALGYVIHTRGLTLYYTGDTNYFGGLRVVGERFRPDLVLLNLNAHLHGEDAARAVHDLGDPLVIPIHWGAYSGTNAMLSPGWRADFRERLGDLVILLGVGKTLTLDRWLRDPPGTFDP